MAKTQAVAIGQDELFTLETGASVELETEAPATEAPDTEPTPADMASAAELESIVNGYGHDAWIDVMLSIDSHNVGMSRGVAAERLFIERRKAQAERRALKAQAQAERTAELEAQAQALKAQRKTKTYAAMTEAMAQLRTRGVVMTLNGRKVSVESVQWSKAERKAVTELVATFTYAAGRYSVALTGSKSAKFNLEQVVNLFTEILPERPQDLMPRKYRDIMRTHRHKNMTPSDVTGNRAVRAVESATDILSAADTELYPEYLKVEGPRMTTSGKRSRQGEQGMTADERRASDRERLKVWRERKRAEKLAAEQSAAS